MKLSPNQLVSMGETTDCPECGLHFYVHAHLDSNPLLDLDAVPKIDVRTPRTINVSYPWEKTDPLSWDKERFEWALKHGRIKIEKQS